MKRHLTEVPLFSYDVQISFLRNAVEAGRSQLFRALSDSEQTVRPARPDQPAHHGIVIAHTSVFDPSKNV
jgi:hypothetical protein